MTASLSRPRTLVCVLNVYPERLPIFRRGPARNEIIGDLLALPGRVELAQHPLRRRGWSFVGPTTVYALMQAMGMVNDHMVGCWRRQPATEGRGGSRPALA